MDPQHWLDPTKSPKLLAMTDARLGRTVTAMFMQFAAKKKGRSISPPEARVLLRKHASEWSSVDVSKPFNAPLKEILRLGSVGRYSEAGRLARAHLIEGAQGIRNKGYAQQFYVAKQKRKKAAQVAGKESAAKRSRVQQMRETAERLLVTKSPREIAGIVASRFKVTPGYARKALKKKRA